MSNRPTKPIRNFISLSSLEFALSFVRGDAVVKDFHVRPAVLLTTERPGAFYVSGKKIDDRFCDQFINISMAGDLGRNVSLWIFINIVVGPVAHENRSPFYNFLEQFLTLHTETLSRKTPLFRFCDKRFSSSCRIW
jgi:hypothetical protein